MAAQGTQPGCKPTAQEIKARSRRNLAIAAALLLFVIFVFVSVIYRIKSGGA